MPERDPDSIDSGEEPGFGGRVEIETDPEIAGAERLLPKVYHYLGGRVFGDRQQPLSGGAERKNAGQSAGARSQVSQKKVEF